MIQNRDKERDWLLDNLKPVGKPKVTLIKFTAEETLQRNITRFKNLWVKLKVKVETLEMPKKIKGQKLDMVIVDEEARWK